MGGWFGRGRGVGFWSVGAVALLLAVMGVSVFAGTGLLSGAAAGGDTTEEKAAPAAAQGAPHKEAVDRSAATELAAREEGLAARKAAEKAEE